MLFFIADAVQDVPSAAVHGAVAEDYCDISHEISFKAFKCCSSLLMLCRTFPQLLFMEQSLRTGVQPETTRSIVAPVIDTFAGKPCACDTLADMICCNASTNTILLCLNLLSQS
jgi:hypothetical protein